MTTNDRASVQKCADCTPAHTRILSVVVCVPCRVSIDTARCTPTSPLALRVLNK